MQIWRNIKPDFSDNRGDIIKVLDDGKTQIRSVLLITSKKDSIRANHYHKTDSHYSYMLSGKMEYTEMPVGGDESQKEIAIVEKGDMVYSAPNVIHAMRFLEDSDFLALSPSVRDQGSYENDLVRVDLIK